MTTTIKELELDSNYAINKDRLLANFRAGHGANLIEEAGYDLTLEVRLTSDLLDKAYPVKFYFHEIAPNALQFSGIKFPDRPKVTTKKATNVLYHLAHDCFAPHLFEANPTKDGDIKEILVNHAPIDNDVRFTNGVKTINYFTWLNERILTEKSS